MHVTCARCGTRRDGDNWYSYCSVIKTSQLRHRWANAAGDGLGNQPAVAKDNPISPNHYARFKIQPLDFIMANGLGFCVGNVIKYVCRFDAKNGLEDLKKARSYLDRLIKAEEERLVRNV